MEIWQKNLSGAITDPDELAAYFSCDPEPIRKVVSRYPLKISTYYLGLINEANDSIWRQCIPDLRELEEDGLVPDPLNEEVLSPVPNLIHRYPDRVVMTVSHDCSVYCRFCMRKRKIGHHEINSGNCQLDEAIQYIADNTAVRDVILSGGDPLLLVDDELETILQRLREIPHVEIIRIGTRVPVTLPERITSRLCTMLKKFHPLYINTHFNHPSEVTADSTEACIRLADAGIPLGNQTVLLRNINDDTEVMKQLMQKLLSIRVRPYYIHQMDLVRGTGHFRTDVRCGIKILEGLRGHTSGMAIPHYVIDTPGGKGKVPLLPETGYFQDDMVVLRNYLGETIEYPA